MTLDVKQLRDYDNIEIEEAEKEYLRGRVLHIPWKRIVAETCWGILVLAALILPVVLVRLSAPNFEEYSIIEVKGDKGLNHWMEYIRWCVFFAVVYITFVVLSISLEAGPALVLMIMEKVKRHRLYTFRRHLQYVKGALDWIVATFFFCALSIISALILWNTSFIQTVSKAILSPRAPNLGNVLLERFYVLLLAFSFMQALSSYVLEIISYNFHQTAFARRTLAVNYKFQVIHMLYQMLARGIPNPRPARKYSSKVKLSEDKDLDMSSASRSEEVADAIFNKLCPPDRDYIQESDLRTYFSAAEVGKAFSVFNLRDGAQVDRQEFCEAVFRVHEERHNIKRSLHCHGQIIRKLGTTLDGLAALFSILFGVVLFQLEGTAIVAAFVTVYMGLNFTMQMGMRSINEALQFIFVIHAYDVGDRVIIGDETLLVDRIELFTTIFRRWDNTAAFMVHSNLASQKIYNVRRSGNTCEKIEIKIPTKVSMDALWSFRDALAEYIHSRPADFGEYCDIASFDIANANEMKVEVLVEYRGNFQNIAQQIARRHLIDNEIKRLVTNLETLKSPERSKLGVEEL
jgi:small-conductance mechanosensitive channel